MTKIKYEMLIERALWFPVEKILVITDLHLGYEEALNSGGFFLPRTQYKQTLGDLKKIFEKIGKVNEIVVLGDLKHGFGSISSQEWNEVLGVLDYMKEKSRKIVLIKGNHDKMLEPIAEKRGIEIRDYYVKDGIFFCHGDKMFAEAYDKKIKIILLGHRHPAVSISDKYKDERYKCFLVGKWKGKEVIVLPSFFPLVEGSDVADIEESVRLFIPEKDLRNFAVYAIGDKVYDFGKVKDIELN